MMYASTASLSASENPPMARFGIPEDWRGLIGVTVPFLPGRIGVGNLPSHHPPVQVVVRFGLLSPNTPIHGPMIGMYWATSATEAFHLPAPCFRSGATFLQSPRLLPRGGCAL